MLNLRIKEKITTMFADSEFDFNYGTNVYNYERNQEEVHFNTGAGVDDSGIVEDFIKKNTLYNITIQLFDNGCVGNGGTSPRLTFSTPMGTNLVSTTGFENFINLPNNTQNIRYLSGSDNDLQWKFLTDDPSYSIDINLVKITFEEVSYTEIDLVDPEKGIQITKSIKEISSPDKYKIGYTNTFDVLLNSNSEEYLRFKNVVSNSTIEYKAIISDTEYELMLGSVKFTEILDNSIRGIDTIKCQFFQEGGEFFENIKLKNIKDLTDMPGGLISYNNISLSAPTSSSTATYYYGIVDNGNFDSLSALDSGNRGVNERVFNEIKSYAHESSFSVGDIYPSVYVRKIWDEIHSQENISYSGDIFKTDNWNALLLNYWNDFNYTKEKIEELKSTAAFNSTWTLYRNSTNTSYDSLNTYVHPSTYDGSFDNYGYDAGEYTIMKSKFNLKVVCDIDVDVNFETYDNVMQTPWIHMLAYGIVEVMFIGNSVGEPNDPTQNNYFLKKSYPFSLRNYGQADTKFELDISDEIDYNLFNANESYRIFIKVIPTSYWQDESYAYSGLDFYEEILKVTITGNLNMDSHEKIAPGSHTPLYAGNGFKFSDVVPKMNQIDFIKNIANLFNLRFEYDSNKNHITWYTFDEYYMKYSDIENFTNIIKKENIKKILGNDFQSNNNLFKYKETTGKYIDLYNSNNKHQYGTKVINLTGELDTKEFVLENGFGIQPFSYVSDEYFALTHNSEQIDNFNSTSIPRKMNNIPFLSYQNIMSGIPIIFRKENLYKAYKSTLPMSSPILYHKNFSANGEVHTLEFFEADNFSTRYKNPTLNNYDLFFQNDYNDIIGKQSEKLEVEVRLNNYTFDKLKLNTIIQFEDDMYRIDSIKNFNENKLTKLNLIKISFNSYYTGTVLEPTPYILPTPYDTGFGGRLSNNLTFTSAGTFDVKYDFLTDSLEMFNSGTIDDYEFSLDGITWITIPVGGWQFIRTVPALINGETVTIHYRLNGVATGAAYTTYWDFKSGYGTNGIIERVTLRTKIKYNLWFGESNSIDLPFTNVVAGETTLKSGTKKEIM